MGVIGIREDTVEGDDGRDALPLGECWEIRKEGHQRSGVSNKKKRKKTSPSPTFSTSQKDRD